MLIHTVFDAMAWLTALAAAWLQTRWLDFRAAGSRAYAFDYLICLVIAAALGAYAIGTANLWLSGTAGLARSIEGALAGAIVGVELYKWRHGIASRTGARFALPFALGVAVGRIGCFFAGVDDFTYGTPASLPWAHDFGDGVPRHPVQLYESATMLGWSVVLVALMRSSPHWVLQNGFYTTVGVYAAQRFVWEFFKPYADLIGPFTLFHLLSAGLALYAGYGLMSQPRSVPA